MSLLVKKVLVLLMAIITTTNVLTTADKSYERDRLDSNNGPSSRQSSKPTKIDQVVKCSSVQTIKDLFFTVRGCLEEKWHPLSPISQSGRLTNDRECCLTKDIRCQEYQIYGHKCERLAGFAEYIRDRYATNTIDCKNNAGIDLSDKFCLGLTTTPVTDPICPPYLTCSMTDVLNNLSSTAAPPIDGQNVTQPNANHPTDRDRKDGTNTLQFSILFITLTLSLNIIFKHL